MKHNLEQTLKQLKKMVGLKKPSRLREGKAYSTDGYFMVLKSWEPRIWRSHRYESQLEDNAEQKILDGFSEAIHELDLGETINIHSPSYFKLTCEHHDAYIDPSILALLIDCSYGIRGFKLNLSKMKIMQGDDPNKTIYFCIEKEVIAVAMPMRSVGDYISIPKL